MSASQSTVESSPDLVTVDTVRIQIMDGVITCESASWPKNPNIVKLFWVITWLFCLAYSGHTVLVVTVDRAGDWWPGVVPAVNLEYPNGAWHAAAHSTIAGGPTIGLQTKVIRRFKKISKSRRRPRLGPSPGWSHKGRAAIRHYANQTPRPLWLLRRRPNFTSTCHGVNACLA